MTTQNEGTPISTPPPRMKTTHPYRHPSAALMRRVGDYTGSPLDPYGRGGESKPTPILVHEGAIVSAPGAPFTLGPTPRTTWVPIHSEGPTCTKVVVRQVRVAAWVRRPYHPTLPWAVWCSCGHVITTQPQATWVRAMAVAHAWVRDVQRMRAHSPIECEPEPERTSKDKAKRKRKAKVSKPKAKAKHGHKVSKHKAKAKA